MLKKTFCHACGISENSEKILWENNVDSWEKFLENFHDISCLPYSKLEKIRTEILFSIENLNNNNLNYFKEKLNSKDHWRLADFGKICFVDIETTGLSRWTDDITMIGIYDGEVPYIYVKDDNLEEAREKLKEFDIVVTFNGKQFDLPFIEHKFGEKYDLVHLDLRFLLREFGFKGGLKKIEKELGVNRAEEVADIDGFEAVRLWRRYKKGDESALELLLKYNEEDIVNLKYLLEYYLNEKMKLL
ncbi:MAG: ribonuclease H-like domain-containing protein, partial [Nanoarchaeota archaeon]|nr:ribonuclease H-like domain-containing protein [Nanoarchaeota archaeon]